MLSNVVINMLNRFGTDCIISRDIEGEYNIDTGEYDVAPEPTREAKFVFVKSALNKSHSFNQELDVEEDGELRAYILDKNIVIDDKINIFSNKYGITKLKGVMLKGEILAYELIVREEK